MDPLSTLKQIRDIIAKCNDPKLVKPLLQLQNEFFALESQNLELAAEVASLKRQVDLRATMHARPPFCYYFQEEDDVPFCPKCWESRGETIHLTALQQSFTTLWRDCPVCKETFWETTTDKSRRHAHHA
jgi:hypothetical protein